MKELATTFDEVIDLRSQAKHYDASVKLNDLAKKLKIDLDDVLDLFIQYLEANK
jgi:thermostable 8-oxoguanine DNA glycosylase